MHALPEGDVAGGCIIGMGTVAVHSQAAVYLQDGAIIARDRKFPESRFRDIQIARKDKAEMVLVRSALDGRRRENAAVYDRRCDHLRRAQECAPMIGVAATRLQLADGHGWEVLDRKDMGM